MSRPRKQYSDSGLTPKQVELRELATADLKAFIALVAPYRVLGHCHHSMINFFMEEHNHQLVIWPRAHQKSTILAYWAAWHIINNPDTTIILASATADLAEKQLGFIKDTILDSPIVRKYWPELLHEEESKREMWRTNEISVDHWKRKEEGIRDPSIKAVGMGGNITGFHADVLLLDDIVVAENAYTKTDRDKVNRWASLVVSILNTDGKVKAVGTRYHPEDLYAEMMTMMEPVYDDDGEQIDEIPVYDYSIEVVERDQEYLWPRQKRYDGRAYGFNRKELSRIKAQYIDKAQFFAQYYNDPSDPLNKRIDNFAYYDRSKLTLYEGRQCIDGQPLNIFAAIDFAASMTDKADYTAIVVIGVNAQHQIFVLEIARFKTNKISEMSRELNRLYEKWSWMKLRAECNAQQGLVVEQLKENNRKAGVFYSIDKIHQTVNKELRVMTNLEPRYAEGMIFHYQGGNCQLLEDELQSTKPPHDDISDAFASCVEIITAPVRRKGMKKVSNISIHPRFGGVIQ